MRLVLWWCLLGTMRTVLPLITVAHSLGIGTHIRLGAERPAAVPLGPIRRRAAFLNDTSIPPFKSDYKLYDQGQHAGVARHLGVCAGGGLGCAVRVMRVRGQACACPQKAVSGGQLQ